MTGRHEVNEPDKRARNNPGTGASTRNLKAARSTHPLLGLQRAAGNKAVSGFVQRLSGPSPSAGTAAPTSGASAAQTVSGPPVMVQRLATGGGGFGQTAAGGGTEGPAQPLSQLNSVESADYAANLAQAAPASGSALQTEQSTLTDQLPSRPTPTGLPVGEAPAVPAPTDPAAPPPLPAPQPSAGPTQTDDLARQGGTAVTEAAAGAQVELPQAQSIIRPTETPPALPALDVKPPPPVPRPAAVLEAAGAERKALNASMNAEVHEMTGRALAPALAASATHRTEVTTTRTGAEQQISTAESNSTSQQRAAAAAADTEVRGLHAGWQREKAGVLSSSQGQIQAEAGQTRAEADRTMNEAQSQAQSQAQTAQQTPNAQRDGLWDRIKSGVSNVAGAVGNLAAGAANLVKGIFEAAKQRVVGMISRLGQVIREKVNAAVNALREGVRRVGTAISGAIKRGRETVGRIAGALAAATRRIWEAAQHKLKNLWGRLTAAVGKAVAAAASIAKRIADALAKVKQIVKMLDNKLMTFMAEVVQNPEEKVGKALVAIASPFAGSVPGKAAELGKEKAQGGPSAASATPVQRQPAPGPPGETFWGGVKRHAKYAGDKFMEHWVKELLKVVASILLFPIAACLEVPALIKDLKGIFDPQPGGMDRLDHFLGVLRTLVNIAGLIVAGVGVWAFLIGLVFPPSEPFLGAGYYAISMGVLAADAIVAAAQLTNSYIGASNPKAPEKREMYLGIFSGSLIGAAITAIMVILGAIAAWLAKVFRGFRAGAAAAAGESVKPKVGKGEPIGEPAATDVGAKGGPEPRPREWPYTNPPNMRTVPPGTPLDLKSLDPHTKYLWVVDGEGNFKFAPERQNSADLMKPIDPPRPIDMKHGDLQPGPGGFSRGPARAGGELHNVADVNGKPSDIWCINNDSSYTFRRVGPNGEPLPWSPAESVEAVRQHLIDGGTPGEKLMTSDVLAKERLERGVP